MICIGVLTLSDKGSRGERVDESGRIARELLAPVGVVSHYELLPDDEEAITARLRQWCDVEHLDLIVTTGGTGLTPRDVTPQATAPLLDYEVVGMAEAMRHASLKITPYAMISRALAGVRGSTLIINLPGSPKGVSENLNVVLPVLKHAIEKLQGAESDCAR